MRLNEYVFSTLGDFLQVEKWMILRSNAFASNSVSNWEKIYGDFSDVATGLWRGLFEPYAMSRMVPAFQIGQNVHRRRPQIWTAFHVNGRRSRWESACCDSSKSSPNCPWTCRRSRNLSKFVPPDFDRQTEDASCCRKIYAASADRCTNRETCHSQSVAVWSFKCWWKLSEKCHNRWWNLGVRLRCRKKSAVVAVYGKIVATTKKSK